MRLHSFSFVVPRNELPGDIVPGDIERLSA